MALRNPLALLALLLLAGVACCLACPWTSHCQGDPCRTYDDCYGSLTCISGHCASGTPQPTPKPTSGPTKPTPAPTKPTPAPTNPTPAPTSGGTVVGRFTWPRDWDNGDGGHGQEGHAPSGLNLAIAFTGEISPSSAVTESGKLQLPGSSTKFISLGGGDSSGAWTVARITAINTAISSGLGGTFKGYAGICYDIEEGAPGLSAAFKASFQLAKSKGFLVMVTVSHSAPYGISDAKTVLMPQLLASPDIDIMVPQLYSGGGLNNFEATAGALPWSAWSACKAKLVPVIPNANNATQLQKATVLFAAVGLKLGGIIQWQ